MQVLRLTTLTGLANFTLALQASPGTAYDSPAATQSLALVRAEAMIDAFYSFNPARLRAAMSDAPKSSPVILYYQGWAEGGNYKVLDRKPCRYDKPDKISCSITVKDDLIAALGTGYDVTDTFHMTTSGDRIVAVTTSSNDPPQMKQAFDWLVTNDPDFLKVGACRGFFAGGPTPQACIRHVVEGFREFTAKYPPVPR